MGVCLRVGDFRYIQNKVADAWTYSGASLCSKSCIPPFPVELTFINNVPTTSIGDVPNWILLQDGTQ